MKEAIIFIDGNNLYHNLKKIKVKPSILDFRKLVNFICNQFQCDLQEARYYNSMPTIRDSKELYYSHLRFLDNLKKIPKFTIHTRKLQVHSTKELLNEQKGLIESMTLCDKCKPIVQETLLKTISNIKKKEKGIDVMLAVDLVKYAIKTNINTLIVFSGDADFIPAMMLAKESKKEVVSVSLVKGYSLDLRTNFKFFAIGKNKIIENCLK